MLALNFFPLALCLLLTFHVHLIIASSSFIHAPGYCSLYDNCGKKSFFGSELPCPSNIRAVSPPSESLSLLNDICGTDFDFDKVCCSYDQILNLQTNLKKADPIISSCPACKKNFYNFFCSFTCSSNQSLFVDIDAVGKSTSGKEIVTELTQFIDPIYATKFYDSCKNLKFSATNGFAMDLIGGGAKNYSSFLKFLGDEKPMLGGSPFQINFRYDIDPNLDESGIELSYGIARDCDDEEYKCACSDCLTSCPTLPEIKPVSDCKVGSLTCSSIYIFLFYFTALVFFIYFKHRYIKKEGGLRLPPDALEASVAEQSQSQPLLVPYKKVSFNNNLKKFFQMLGFYCSSFPAVTLSVSLIAISLFSSGLYWLSIETNAVNLWVSPDEPALKQLQYFESKFGEWFRIEQIIIKKTNEKQFNNTSEGVLNWEVIQWWFEKELELQNFKINSTSDEFEEELNLKDFCFKPLGETCAIESFTQYFQGDINYLTSETWKSKISGCASSPVNCLPTFQQPLKKELLFGSYVDESPLSAKAFVVTLLLNKNSTNTHYSEQVVKYETQLKNWLLKLQTEAENLNLEVSFSTEISLEEELNKSTNTDIKIIIISYVMMFFYASLALGGYIPSLNNISTFIRTRFQLGLSGIILVLLSITSAAGFFSFLGLKSTLIIAEVIPFLVLAIGIDNIFLIVEELDKVNKKYSNLSIQHRISKTLGSIGPSCFISAIIQIFTLLLATTVQMPAVKNFAFYSAGAILCNFILQMTVFVSILSLDQKRLENNRIDCLPFLKVSDPLHEQNLLQNLTLGKQENVFNFVITKKFAPFILHSANKKRLLTLFLFWFGISLSLLPNIEFGLDQRIAIPSESYLVDYFNDIYDHLNVGPPIFFVVENSNISFISDQQKVCGKFSTCNEFSIINILEQEYKRSNISTISEPASSWIDDFLTWLNPDLDECCRFSKNSQSPLDQQRKFCGPYDSPRSCESCYANHNPKYDITMSGFPEGEEFMFFFKQWIEQPSDPCPLGGKAPYSKSIFVNENDDIEAFYFRTSHKPLRSQHDFIEAYEQSLRVVKYMKAQSDVQVFAFSPFYIFFVQYSSIVKLTFSLILIALGIVWAVTSFLIDSRKNSLILVITVIMILTNIGGIMSMWTINLNAVSLVNLIICVGLAVEFCIHITRNFTMNNGLKNNDTCMDLEDKDDIGTLKAFNALKNIGGSVLGGITMTKLIGICVLAFTRSQIFEIYYFRMWLSLIVIASLHSLCLLPILLSFFGDTSGKSEEEYSDDFYFTADTLDRLRYENYSEEE